MSASQRFRRQNRRKNREMVAWQDCETTQDKLHLDVHANEAELKQQWANCDDFVCTFRNIHQRHLMFVTIGTLVDDAIFHSVLESLHEIDAPLSSIEQMQSLINVGKCDLIDDFHQVNQALCDGWILIFVHDEPQAIAIETQNLPQRAIEKPELEPTILGPQQAFIETLATNIALVRARLKSQRLKVVFLTVGTVSQTKAALTYIEGIAKPTLIEEVITRFKSIELDAVLDSNYVIELVRDAPRSLFPTIQSTERPDRTAASLLRGQFAILVDGSPGAIVAPVGLFDFFETPEDLYTSYLLSFPIRLLRHFNFWLSLLGPSLYIALLTFQQEMLPTRLLLALQQTHEGIPFPTIIEAAFMEMTFESLREAGIRLPRTVGQSVSIVGALVIGDAAVNAGIVSPGMVIVVAATGIASFSIPSYNLAFATRVLRFPCMFAAGMFGLYGVSIFMLMLFVHLLSIRSFGVPYISMLSSQRFSSWKRVIFRGPMWANVPRSQLNEPLDKKRSSNVRPSPSRGKSRG
ncbi:spore germination protein [Alicyclobacillus fodiniaquatilis]|uniref:Spore germination protein n=1 Tax=Alicyclobacillus fodiniaquatilis TaxID=1661150 RepID=A0ABW4JCX0_9BACL